MIRQWKLRILGHEDTDPAPDIPAEYEQRYYQTQEVPAMAVGFK